MSRILVSNDDGVNAPGIIELYKSLRSEGHETWVIAPAGERSTTGHSLNLDRPLRLHEIQEQVYSCSGFPADCVLMGIGHVLRDRKPDIIISGINRGANMAQDLYYSGTMAAAREGSFHHYPSVAVSLVCSFYRKEEIKYYDTAAKAVNELVKRDIQKAIPQFSMVNVNVPNLPWQEIKGFAVTRLGFRNYSENIEHRIDSRGRDYYWIAGNHEGDEKTDGNTDCEKIDSGYISITPLDLLGRDKNFDEVTKLIERMNNELGF